MIKHLQKILIATISILLVILMILIGLHVVQSSWSSIRSSILPQFVPAEKKETDSFIHVPFSPKVDIGFVIDGETQYTFIREKHLQEWEVSEEMVIETAMRNLERISKDLKLEVAVMEEDDSTQTYIIVEPNDSYAAVRLLSNDVRKTVSNMLGEESIAAIPTRDFLIFWHPEFSLRETFAMEVRSAFENEKDYPLSQDLFFVSQEGIQPMKLVNTQE